MLETRGNSNWTAARPHGQTSRSSKLSIEGRVCDAELWSLTDRNWPGAAGHRARTCDRCPTHCGHSIPCGRGLRTAWECRSPSLAISDARHDRIDARRAFLLMMWFHRSTRGKLSHPLPFHSLARRGATKRDAPVRPIAWERKNLPSARLNPAIARQPAWMLDFALGIHRQLGNRPDGKFLAAARRDLFTVRFTVRLKGIPAIDLDRSRQTSRQTFACRINAPGPLCDSSR